VHERVQPAEDGEQHDEQEREAEHHGDVGAKPTDFV
jgi:hypothetical protein